MRWKIYTITVNQKSFSTFRIDDIIISSPIFKVAIEVSNKTIFLIN